jgi:hypothetical protein
MVFVAVKSSEIELYQAERAGIPLETPMDTGQNSKQNINKKL